MFDVIQIITLAIIGLSAGLAGGLLGVGGSIVMIPALTEMFGPDQHTYQATAMIVNFFVVVPAVIQHRRAGAIQTDVVLRIIPLAIVAVIAGVALSETSIFAGTGEKLLRRIFALFLVAVIAHDFYRMARPVEAKSRSARTKNGEQKAKGLFVPSWNVVAAIAIPTGLMAGLLGVGGGVLAVPLLRRLLGLSIRSAIAHSASLIVATSLVGAIAKNFALTSTATSGMQPLVLAALLAPLAIAGSYWGSHLTHRLPIRLIKGAFLILMMLAAVRLATTS